MRTKATDLLGIEFPIFAFSHCRDVVAAVTNAGGCGVLGAVAHTPEQLDIDLDWIEDEVDGKPYGVDLLVPQKYVGRRRGRARPRRRCGALIPDEHRRSSTTSSRATTCRRCPTTTQLGRGVGGMTCRPEEHGAAARRALRPQDQRSSPPRSGRRRRTSSSAPTAQGILVAALAGTVEHAERHAGGGRRPHRRPGHRGRRPHRRDRDDGARARGRRRGRADAGARRRRHRPRPPDRGGAWRSAPRACGAARCGSRPRRPRRHPVVKEKFLAAGVGRHGPVPLDHRQAGPHAAHARGPTSGSAPTAPARCRCRCSRMLVGRGSAAHPPRRPRTKARGAERARQLLRRPGRRHA